MKVVIVDDEELALEVMERLLNQIGGVQIIGKYTDPFKALEVLSVAEVDAVFLDLEMGGFHGLQFTQELFRRNIQTEVIFITAYSQYAVEAFEMDALDYLLKPVTSGRLKKTLEKLEVRIWMKERKRIPAAEQPAGLYVHSLGAFQLCRGEYDARTTARWRTKKVKEMFCYLWLNNKQPVNKHRILEELWPEVTLDKGTALLHTTVYQLRKTLKELGCEDGVEYMNDNYILTLPQKSDLEEVRYILKIPGPTDEQIKRLITLYQGDLLEQEEYGWCFYEQQNLRKLYLEYLQKYTVQNMGRNRNSIIESCLLKIVQMDPYNEQFVILLLSYYGNISNTTALTGAYNHYCMTLKEELDLMPSRKVIETYRKYIKKG